MNEDGKWKMVQSEIDKLTAMAISNESLISAVYTRHCLTLADPIQESERMRKTFIETTAQKIEESDGVELLQHTRRMNQLRDQVVKRYESFFDRIRDQLVQMSDS